ncbi:PilN domain-containing protein [Ruminiclostridium cellobioparum]|uniref:PilN domain-containing protein n=1 Tax=Ruminiclostridium cellobioparum TaxID=29355 RepID=UPI0028B2629D|nr:PilN domain-containing protein [Ruminiclostridium cellobioparum]
MKDINLIPDESKNPVLKADAEKKGISVKSIILTVIILSVAAAGFFSPRLYVKTLENEAVSIQDELNSDKYTEIKKVNTDIAAAQDEISVKKAVIEDISKNSVDILELTNYVEQAAPLGISVNGIQYTNSKLTVKGYSKDSTAIAEYMANLTRVDLLTDYAANAKFAYEKANTSLEYTLEFTKSKRED